MGLQSRCHPGLWSSGPLLSESHSVMSNSLRPHRLYSPWYAPGQNTGVGSRSLLQEIFSTPGLNPGLLHCRQILYHLSHQGSPDLSLGYVVVWLPWEYVIQETQPEEFPVSSMIQPRMWPTVITTATFHQSCRPIPRHCGRGLHKDMETRRTAVRSCLEADYHK